MRIREFVGGDEGNHKNGEQLIVDLSNVILQSYRSTYRENLRYLSTQLEKNKENIATYLKGI